MKIKKQKHKTAKTQNKSQKLITTQPNTQDNKNTKQILETNHKTSKIPKSQNPKIQKFQQIQEIKNMSTPYIYQRLSI